MSAHMPHSEILPDTKARCSGNFCLKKQECKRFLAGTISSNSKVKLIDSMNCIEPIFNQEKQVKKAYSKLIPIESKK